MPIALVQSAKKDVNTVTTTTLAFPSNVTPGNMLAVSCVTFQGSAGVPMATPSDTLGHSYAGMAAQQNDTPNNLHLRSWFFPNCSGGANTVTAGSTGASSEVTVIISEWSGVSLSSPISGTPSLTGPVTTSAPSSGDVTPADPNCLMYAVVNFGGSSTTCTEDAGQGWTLLQEYVGTNNTVTLAVAWKLQNTAVAEDCDWTIGYSPVCFAHLVAFKPLLSEFLFPRRAYIPFRRSN